MAPSSRRRQEALVRLHVGPVPHRRKRPPPPFSPPRRCISPRGSHARILACGGAPTPWLGQVCPADKRRASDACTDLGVAEAHSPAHDHRRRPSTAFPAARSTCMAESRHLQQAKQQRTCSRASSYVRMPNTIVLQSKTFTACRDVAPKEDSTSSNAPGFAANAGTLATPCCLHEGACPGHGAAGPSGGIGDGNTACSIDRSCCGPLRHVRAPAHRYRRRPRHADDAKASPAQAARTTHCHSRQARVTAKLRIGKKPALVSSGETTAPVDRGPGRPQWRPQGCGADHRRDTSAAMTQGRVPYIRQKHKRQKKVTGSDRTPALLCLCHNRLRRRETQAGAIPPGEQKQRRGVR